MWKHREEAEEQISLHDCRATHIAVEEHSVRFHFTDGFWMLPGTAYNPSENILKTTASVLKLHLNPEYRLWGDIEIFRRKQTAGKKNVWVRENKSLEWLIRMISVHGASLEFVDEYRRAGGSGRLYGCWLWLKKAPYHIECRIEFEAIRKIEYCWNTLDPERIW